jgi:GDP/UDP-N,N'-diacetylbacillosamine 2-epimerase (hydrolysing)
MKIGVLTSSRADYGIYLPLIQELKCDSFFELEIIAFGTHLSLFHGYTINEIEKDGYNIIHKLSTILTNDDKQSIATSYGLTALKFSDFWTSNYYDFVFCLGDRFEMNAAVQAGIPFGIRFAHIHGGETTLGALDNIYRHQISLASHLHFIAADCFKKRLIDILGNSENIYSTGSLSLSNIKSFIPINKLDFFEKFKIPNSDYILVTFHPETVSLKDNFSHVKEIKEILSEIVKIITLVITMPNADMQGSLYREVMVQLEKDFPSRVVLIENFGKENYFSAMYYSKIMLGNTSSGIIEAASFGKYVVNVGDRQKGRAQSENIFNCKFNKNEIAIAVNKALNLKKFNKENIYYKDFAVQNIIKIIKSFNEKA